MEGVESWTLAERRIWNLLLVNAWSDRLEDPTAVFEDPALMSCAACTRATTSSVPTCVKLQTALVSGPSLPSGGLRTVQMLGGHDLEAPVP